MPCDSSPPAPPPTWPPERTCGCYQHTDRAAADPSAWLRPGPLRELPRTLMGGERAAFEDGRSWLSVALDRVSFDWRPGSTGAGVNSDRLRRGRRRTTNVRLRTWAS